MAKKRQKVNKQPFLNKENQSKKAENEKKQKENDKKNVERANKAEEWGKDEPIKTSAKRHLDSVSHKIKGKKDEDRKDGDQKRKEKRDQEKRERPRKDGHKGPKGTKGKRDPTRDGRHGRHGRRKRPKGVVPPVTPPTTPPDIPPTIPPSLPPTTPIQPQPPSPVNPVTPPEDGSTVIPIEDTLPLTPPTPRPVVSPPIPPPPKKTTWDSRVGYFVALSDIHWYEEVPTILESPFVDLNFEDEPEGFLRLREGEVWKSKWFDTGVIRGLNIDVLGKHKLTYSKNGDFET